MKAMSAMKTKAMKQAKKVTFFPQAKRATPLAVTKPVKAKAMKAKAMKAKPMKAPARAMATKKFGIPVKNLVLCALPARCKDARGPKDARMVPFGFNSSMTKRAMTRIERADLQIDIEELEQVLSVLPDICCKWLRQCRTRRVGDSEPTAASTMAALKHLLSERAINDLEGCMTCLIWTSKVARKIPDDLEGGVLSALHWLEEHAERQLKKKKRRHCYLDDGETPDTRIAKQKDTGKMKHTTDNSGYPCKQLRG